MKRVSVFELMDDEVAYRRYRRAQPVMFAASCATIALLMAASVAGPYLGWTLLWVGCLPLSVAIVAALYFWEPMREHWVIFQTLGIVAMFLSVVVRYGVHWRHDLWIAANLAAIVLIVAGCWLVWMGTKLCMARTREVQRQARELKDRAIAKVRDMTRRAEVDQTIRRREP